MIPWKPVLLLIAVGTCLGFASQPQSDVPKATYYALEQNIRHAKLRVVSIEAMTKTGAFSQAGSGFAITFRNHDYVVTCRHVVELARRQGQPAIGLNTSRGKMVREATIAWIDSGPDIAVLGVGRELAAPSGHSSTGDTIYYLHTGFTTDQFAADSAVEEGAGVLMIGYPLGLGASEQVDRPVSRLGMVALGVVGDTVFLVDGAASHGNSGSPIFLCSTGELAGMAYAQEPDRIDVYDENQNLVAALPYNSGLTTCIPASVILRFLNQH